MRQGDNSQKNWSLTVEQAKNARITGLGAYYRLRREILDYHAALNEVGVIVASAQVHRGWIDPGKGFIRKSNQHEGGHAFVIVGYDAEGFLVQNSWGRNWGSFNGRPGIAHWSYSDWAENTRDAWVLRLGVPTPEAFDLTHLVERKTSAGATTAVELREPRRQDIVGHFVHLDDGKLVETGRYATPLDTLRETGRWIKDDENRPSPKYDHLLFYAHGGLNSAADSARMIAATKEGFKRNRIYPVFFMWETGLFESLKDVLAGLFGRGVERIGGASDISDAILEKLARPTGRSIWRDIKSDAAKAFRKNAGGASAIAEIVGANLDRKAPLQMHVAGHSAGAVFLGELLKTWTVPTPIASAALMAPACTVGFYKNAFLPALSGAKPMLGRIEQYNLIDAREIADNVAIFYRKSLLYLVSRALEEHDEEPLLGLERHSSTLPLPARHIVRYAGRDRPQTDSPNHSGFDNDVATMNSLLALILGVKPKPSLAFKANELDFG